MSKPLVVSLLTMALILMSVAAPLRAERLVIDADNAGSLDGTGRVLSFDLSTVTGEIVAAALHIDIQYSHARDLDWTLGDGGDVSLPLAMMSGVSNAVGMQGRYRITDAAVSTWPLLAPVSGNLPNHVPARAFQFGQGGECLNLLGRFLEFDVNRMLPLQLQISRLGAAQGNGVVTAARLVIDTESVPELFDDNFEDQGQLPTDCQRPSFDVLPNGASEHPSLSPFTLLDYTGMPDWHVRQFDPPLDFGPIAFGAGNESQAYPGRFGGRSRMNIGYWDAGTGNLNFIAGNGVRSLHLPGDWTTTFHLPIPGDYDGDGITDLAMAFLGHVGVDQRFLARILFSRSNTLRDFVIDPRTIEPAVFTSADIGFGAGQDAFERGRDEITLYARDISNNLRLMQLLFTRDGFLEGAFSGPSWGIPGDRMVLGNWVNGSGGNHFGMMVVRATMGQLEWYLFPNAIPTLFGASTDLPLSIHVDHDRVNDIAIYRQSDQMVHAIRSSDGQQVSFGPFGSVNSIPLANILGTTAPLAF